MIAKSMGPEARPSRGVASRQAASSAAAGRTAETLCLSRLRLTCFARSEHNRKSDGISRREEFLHRRLLRAFDVSFAVQDARGCSARTREHDPRYDWPNLSPTQCVRGKASLAPIRAKRSTFDASPGIYSSPSASIAEL